MHQKKGGCSLRGTHCKWNLVPSRKQVTHKLSGTKAICLGPKGAPRPLLEQYCCHSHRQHHCGCLYKEEGVMKSGPLCALLWRILTWCSGKQVTLKARHIPGRLNVRAGKLSRLGQTIQTEWSLLPEFLSSDMLPVAPAPSGPVCH